jgi:ABC-2 type transport system ATP-binding protein
MADFVTTAGKNAVIVRTPQGTELAALLEQRGGRVTALEPGLLSVVGLDAAAVGDIAFDSAVRLHELTNHVATLEEAFLEATGSAQEFEAHGLLGSGDEQP